jgi:4-hydroxy-2-oxoheptanedioate aldolase
MRTNTLRTRWAEGRRTLNGWCSIPSSFAAEVMAHQGWESVTVDMQHGLVDYQAMVGMLQAISTTDAVPMVRVPWLEAGIIMKSLDAGSYGVICPMINTPEEAARLVGYCSYPPQGERSFGPIRATLYAGNDYPAHANATVLKIAMVETEQALRNVQAICATPGLDGVYVGPSDLAASLGYTPKLDPTEPAVVEAVKTILQAAKAKGLVAGIHTGEAAYAAKVHDWGFDFATIGSDSRLMAAKAQEQIGLARSGTAGKTDTSTY